MWHKSPAPHAGGGVAAGQVGALALVLAGTAVLSAYGAARLAAPAA